MKGYCGEHSQKIEFVDFDFEGERELVSWKPGRGSAFHHLAVLERREPIERDVTLLVRDLVRMVRSPRMRMVRGVGIDEVYSKERKQKQY